MNPCHLHGLEDALLLRLGRLFGSHPAVILARVLLDRRLIGLAVVADVGCLNGFLRPLLGCLDTLFRRIDGRLTHVLRYLPGLLDAILHGPQLRKRRASRQAENSHDRRSDEFSHDAPPSTCASSDVPRRRPARTRDSWSQGPCATNSERRTDYRAVDSSGRMAACGRLTLR